MRRTGFTLIFIIAILFSCALVLADVGVQIAGSSDGTNKTFNDLSTLAKANINHIQDYIRSNYPELARNPELGKIVVDENEGVTLKKNDESVLFIPKGLKIENKNNVLAVSGKITPILNYPERPDVKYFPKLSFGKVEINSENEISVRVSEDSSGTQTILFSGDKISLQDSAVVHSGVIEFGLGGINVNGDVTSGTLTVDNKNKKIDSVDVKFKDGSDGTIKIGKVRSGEIGNDLSKLASEIDSKFNVYNNLKEASFKLNENGETKYADLVSSKGGEYTFNYNGKKFSFKAKKDGHITFDPENKIISGEKTNLDFEGGDYLSSIGKFSLKLDSLGNALQINLDKTGSFTRKENSYSSRNGLTISLDSLGKIDGTDIKDFKGDYVSFEGPVAKMKGFVEVLGTTQYRGKSSDTYTELETEKKFFDVKSGNAELFNSKHKISIENGIAKLSQNKDKSIILSSEESFRFSHYTKEGVKIEGFIDEGTRNFEVTSYKSNGDKITTVKPFSGISELRSDLGLLAEKINFDNYKETSVARLKDLDAQITQLKKNPTEENQKLINSLELNKVIIENERNRFFGKSVDESIKNLETFLATDLDSSTKTHANMLLAEAIERKASSLKSTSTFGIRIHETSSPSEYSSFDSVTFKKTTDEYGNTKITGYSLNSGLNWHTLDEEIPEYSLGASKLSSSTTELLASLKSSGGLLDTISQSISASSGKITQDSITAPVSEQISSSDYYKEAASKWKAVLDSAGDDSDLKNVASLNLARISANLGNTADALSSFTEISKTSENPLIQSEAYRLMARVMESDTTAKINEKLQTLSKAVELDPTNSQAKADYSEFAMSLSGGVKKTLAAERLLPLQDVYNKFGNPQSYFGENWANAFTNTPNVFYYQLTMENPSGEVSSQMNEIFSKNDLQRQGVDTLVTLQQQGEKVSDFLAKTTLEREDTISRYRGYEMISSTDLSNHLKEIGVPKDVSELSNQERFDIIENWQGSSIAGRDLYYHVKAMGDVGGLSYSLQNNPAIALIATDGKKDGASAQFAMSSDAISNLDSAFELERYSGKIEKDLGGKIVDYIPSAKTTLELVGAGKMAAWGIGGITSGELLTFKGIAKTWVVVRTLGTVEVAAHWISPGLGEATDDLLILAAAGMPVENPFSKSSDVSPGILRALEGASADIKSARAAEALSSTQELAIARKFEYTSDVVSTLQKDLGDFTANLRESEAARTDASYDSFSQRLGISEYKAGLEEAKVGERLGNSVEYGWIVGKNPDGTYPAELLGSSWNPKVKPTEIIDATRVIDPEIGKFPDSYNGDYFYAIRKDGSMLMSSESPIPVSSAEGLYAAGKLTLENGVIKDIELPEGLDIGNQNAFGKFTRDALFDYGYKDKLVSAPGLINEGGRFDEINTRETLSNLLEKYIGVSDDIAFETARAEAKVSSEFANPKLFSGVQEIPTAEIESYYKGRDILDGLADESDGVRAATGSFKDTYIIDSSKITEADLAKLPDNIRKIISEGDSPVTIKFLKEDPSDAAFLGKYNILETRATDFVNELDIEAAINRELETKGMEKLFPDKTYQVGVSFETVNGKPVLRGVIVETTISEESGAKILRELNKVTTPEELARANELVNKINNDLDTRYSELQRVFEDQGVLYMDANPENFAIGFKDRLTGKTLTTREILDGDYNIEYGIKTYVRAYEAGGAEFSRTGNGYLTNFEGLKMDINSESQTALLESISKDNLLDFTRQIDLDRIELTNDEISRVRLGDFNSEELERINTAENLLNKKLSTEQKSELILSHNAANELYSVDDFGRISTKARLLSDFSAEEKRVLMENEVVGENNLLKSLTFRTAEQLKGVKFDEGKVYVRFENVRDANWPEDGEVGNLPFIPEKLNPKRGPRLSTFTLDQLDKDGYFLMKPSAKKEYLAGFGIRTDLSNRNMIYFKLESGTQIESYMNKYTNIIVTGNVPAVKVITVKKAKL